MVPTILMIDDDRFQFRFTQAHFKNFQHSSYEIEWASTYEDGLQKLLSGGYCACLLDYQLGKRDGLQLIREAISKGCRTPIVFLTAESSSSVDIEAMNAGALDYLVKGEITPQALERSLRYAVKLGETLEALHRLAIHDELTGLFNRREFDRILKQEVERAQRFVLPLALVLVDIDHFKAVNDRYGHPAGDAVLRKLAAVLKTKVRSVDWSARIGGEEFAFLLVQGDQATALSTAERLCAAARGTVIDAGGTGLTVTISAGVAVLSPKDKGEHDILEAADRALYMAKSGGRDRVVLAEVQRP